MCKGGNAGTCKDQMPIVVNDTLAFAFAAVPGSAGGQCGKCFDLAFTGKGKYATDNHKKLAGKHLIVIASNIGYDVEAGQFDVMIPGGGVGIFNGCSKMNWGSQGAQYGGLLTECEESSNYKASTYKSCLTEKCNKAFSNDEQARWIGWQGAFYNIAKIAATGGLVYLAGIFIENFGVVKAWMMVMFILAATMLLLGTYHYFILPNGNDKSQTFNSQLVRGKLGELWSVFVEFFQKRHIVYYIFFIILYRFAEGFVMKIVPLFLKAPRAQQGLGLDEKEIGLLYGTFGAAAFVLGSILAGYYIARRGLKRSLFQLALVFNLPFVAYTLLAAYQPESLWVIGSAIVIEYFGYGFGFVGLTLFMMQQIAPGRHQMSHYAFASGIMNLGVMLPGMLSGMVSDALGYRHFFVFVLFCTIPALLITWFVPFKENEGMSIQELRS